MNWLAPLVAAAESEPQGSDGIEKWQQSEMLG